MAEIHCPKCGKANPDFLDTCQFCQTPLTRDPFQIGENPTKKNTGELEPILPDWLKDVRQQGRDSAGENAVQSVTRPNVQKNEAPDLLAGLASQSSDDDDDVPDWLASINPAAKVKPSEVKSSEPASDFFAQFSGEAKPVPAKPKQEVPASPPVVQPQAPVEKDELSAWFSGASERPAEPLPFQPEATSDEMGWMNQLSSSEPDKQEPPAEKEDLSWLHNLETSARQSEEPSVSGQGAAGWDFGAASAPSQSSGNQEDLSWLNNLGSASEPAQPSAPASSQEDLSWLHNLGSTSEPAQPSTSSQEDLGWLNNLGSTPEPARPSAPASSQEDLSWLNNLGSTPEPAQPSTAASSQEDLSWLNNLGSTPEPAQPSTPASSQEDLGWLNNFGSTPEPAQPSAPASSQEDLSWLNNFGSTPEPAQPSTAASSQDDLGWLNNLGSTPEPAQPSEPASTAGDFDWLANLGEVSEPAAPVTVKPFGTTDELSLPKEYEQPQNTSASPFTPRRTAPLNEGAISDNMPDWLKEATEEKPILPLGVLSRNDLQGTSSQKPEKDTPPSKSEPVSVPPNTFTSSGDSLSSQEVDSLFAVDMPDWLSQPQSTAGDVSSQPPNLAARDEALAPVELPSWVQAMRPVESVLSQTDAPGTENQPEEKEGPLAGLRGVIPFVPIGSSRRPKAFSLKLQATEEQQIGAALLDQILTSETTPRTITPSSAFMPQRVLRWVIAALLWVVLGTVLFMRSQIMQISAVLPPDVMAVSNAVASIPDNSSVLVVIDYEPSLAGEMEAVSGPLLDQIVLAKTPHLVFLSTSPNSSALYERLLASANISKPIPEGGLGYLATEDYSNLGYLPGGSAGVLGFVRQPNRVLPSATAQAVSEYAMVIVITDHAESGRTWVEQLDAVRQIDPVLANRSLILVTSAQAGPLLQPYVSSKQVTGMINGLAEAARYEFVNNSRPGTARLYWDAFGVGILLAVVLIVIGSAWSLISGIRVRRTAGDEG